MRKKMFGVWVASVCLLYCAKVAAFAVRTSDEKKRKKGEPQMRRLMFSKRNLVWLVGIILLTGVGLEAQTPLSCGMVITRPGQYVLRSDLTCEGFWGITVAANQVHINLNGHTLRGLGGVFGIITSTTGDFLGCTGVSGLRIQGGTGVSGLRVLGGTVAGWAIAIELCAPAGSSGSDALVNGVNVTGNVRGIELVRYNDSGFNGNSVSANAGPGFALFDSHNNTFDSNECNDNIAPHPFPGGGFLLVNSRSNLIRANTMLRNSLFGIRLIGSENNLILSNTVRDTNFFGMLVGSGIWLEQASGRNTIQDNTASGNQQFGIVVTGSAENLIQYNTAKGNLIADLWDGSATCNGNIWVNNTFDTANQACIQ